MKAFILQKYGSPDYLKLETIPRPSPGSNDVLVRVCATSINDWDWSIVRGSPFIIRLLCGLLRPKIGVPGVDVSGVVEATGENVSYFQVGDRVYGDLSDCGFGAYAEHVCAPEGALTLIPETMSYEDAASLPHAAMLALQGLVDVGKLQQHHKLLINGAGGGVGAIGVQIAKHMGVQDVTGVDHSGKFDMMRSAGFTNCIDYMQTDFTALDEQYDIILDAKTNRPPTHYLRALKPKGVYVTVGGDMDRLLQLALFSPFIHRLTSKRLKILPLKPNHGMDRLDEIYCVGKLASVVDRVYAFEDMAEALTHFGSGEHLGKVVVSVGENLP